MVGFKDLMFMAMMIGLAPTSALGLVTTTPFVEWVLMENFPSNAQVSPIRGGLTSKVEECLSTLLLSLRIAHIYEVEICYVCLSCIYIYIYISSYVHAQISMELLNTA
jgi:hypothetical protein